jgi:adenylate kinase
MLESLWGKAGARVVLVGPPGAGKGTQSAALRGRLGVPHISTGELFRQHVGAETELGHQARRYLETGHLVPDEFANELVRERLSEQDTTTGFLLDGFPRTVNQAELLTKLLAETDDALDVVIELRVDEDVLVSRLLARGRADDTEAVIRNRQRVYRSQTTPLLDYYDGLLVTVDGAGEVGDVTGRVAAALCARP